MGDSCHVLYASKPGTAASATTSTIGETLLSSNGRAELPSSTEPPTKNYPMNRFGSRELPRASGIRKMILK
jgi:hypothetical protein